MKFLKLTNRQKFILPSVRRGLGDVPKLSAGIRAMAWLMATLVFMQGPVTLMAAVWNPFKVLNADYGLDNSLIGGGSFSLAGPGSHWASGGQLPGANETAQFNLYSSNYDVLVDGTFQIGGLSTVLASGSAGTTVSFLGQADGQSRLELSSMGVSVNAGTLVLDAALKIHFGASQIWSPAAGSILNVASVLSAGSAAYTLLKQRSGLLVLSGNNTFAGGVTLDDGGLAVNASGTSASNSALGTGNLTINGGFLDNTSGAAVSLATNNLQSWNGDFTFLGTGGSTLNMGTGAVTLSADRTVTVSAGTFAVGGVIGGTYSLVKAGAGTLTLSGANTYSGGLTITAGQVNLNHSAAAGTGTLTISGGVIDNTSGSSNTLSNAAHIWNGDFMFVGSDNLNTGSGDITLNAGTVTVLANTLTIGGILGGSIGLTKAGPGRLYLDASATYAGPTVVDAGSLETSGDDFLPMGNDLTIGDAGTVTFASLQTIHSLSGSGKLFVGNTLTISNGSGNAFAGVLSGTGNVTLGSGTLTLGGANAYSGITTLDSGALLKLAHATALGGTAGYTDLSAGAVLDLNGQMVGAEDINVRGDGISGSGALINSAVTAASLLGQVTLYADASMGGAGDLTLSGGVAESGGGRSLSKVGAGVLTLAGSSSFTGATTVSEGVLRLDSPNALGLDSTAKISGVSVSSGAALDLHGITSAVDVALTIGGTGVGFTGALTNSSSVAATYGGDITLAADVSVSGGILLTGNISGTSALTKVGSGTLTLAGASNAMTDIYIDAGLLSVGAGATSGLLGAGSVSLAADTGLVFNRSDEYGGAISNVLTGAGSVTVALGTLTLSGANSYEGATSILAGGTLKLGSVSALGATSGVSVASGAVLDLNGNNASAPLSLENGNDAAVLTNTGADAVYGGAVTLSEAGNSAIDGSFKITLSGPISGGTLNKIGTNTLVLGTLNTYGKTVLASGVIRLEDTGSFGTDTVQIEAGAQIAFARSGAYTVSNVISGQGDVEVASGTLFLTEANTYTGLTTIQPGATLSIGMGDTTGGIQSDIAINAGADLQFNRSDNMVYGGTLSGSGHLNKLGAGKLGLISNSSDLTSGSILVTEGVLSIGAGGTDGALAGNITNNAEVQFNRSGTLTYGEVISGTGSVSSIGVGSVTLSAVQIYSGATQVSAGTFNVSELSNTSSIAVSGGGTLNVSQFNASAALTLSESAFVNVAGTDLSFTGAITNNSVGGSLQFTSTSGSITLSEGLGGAGATGFASNAVIGGTLSAGTVTVAGALFASDIAGASVAASELTSTGTIRAGEVTVLNAATLNSVTGGVLTLGGATTLGQLFGGSLVLQGGSVVLTVSGGNQAETGVLSGSGSVISTGSLTLNGANAYTGGTQLNTGTLTVGHSQALGTGALAVGDGAALDAAALGLTLANQIGLGGTLTFLGTESLEVSGTLTLSAPSTINVSNNAFAVSGSIATGGNALTKTGAGTLALTGPSVDLDLTVSGGTVSAGAGVFGSATTLSVGNDGTVSLLGNQSITSVTSSGQLLLGASTLSLSNGGNLDGILKGESASFLELSAGSLGISGTSNDFKGTLRVTGGEVDLAATTQSVGTAILSGGTIKNGTLQFLNLTLSAGAYEASLSGDGVLTKDSTAGTVSLGADNSAFTGTVVVEGGTLSLEHASALTGPVAVSFTATAGDATLKLGNSISLRSLSGGTVASGSQGIVHFDTYALTLVTKDEATFSGSISATSGSLIISGSGKQILAGASPGAVFNTEIQSGTLEINHSEALGDGVNSITLSGGTLSLAVSSALASAYNISSVSNESTLLLGGTNAQTLGTLSLGGTFNVRSVDATDRAVTFGATTLTIPSVLNVGGFTTASLGAVSGNVDLTKSGDGTLTLTDTNSSTANTFVTGGSLVLGAGGSLASGSLLVTGASTVVDLGGTTQTLSGDVSVTDGTVQAGTLVAGAYTLSGANISAVLAGTGALTSTGASTLAGQNTYSGITTVDSGSLTILAGGSIDSAGILSVSDGAQANFLSATVTLGSIAGAGTTVFAGTAEITQNLASGIVTIGGDALLADLTGANVTVGGAATVGALTSGSLRLNGSGGIVNEINGGLLTLASLKTATVGTLTSGSVSLEGILQANSGTFAGELSGSGSLQVASANALILGGTLSGFSGHYAVEGTLTLNAKTNASASLNVATSAAVNFFSPDGELGAVTNNGTLSVSSGTYALGSLSGAGELGSAATSTLRIGALGTDTTYSGTVSGGITLVKEGAGMLNLSGASTFTGETHIEAGTLVASHGLALSSGSVFVASGASLGLSGGTEFVNPLTLAGSGANDSGALNNLSGQNMLAGFVTLAGDTQISVLGGSLTTGSIAGTANLSVHGPLTIGGTVTLGSTNTLELLSGNLTLNDTVTAHTVLISAGAAVLKADLDAVLDIAASGSASIANSLSVKSLRSAAGSVLDMGGSNLTVADGAGLTANGVLSGTGALLLTNGSLTLGGVNAYSGGTTVNGGSLFVSGAGSLANGSALNINAGTVQFHTTAANVLGDVVVADGGLLRFLSDGGVGALTGAGSLEVGSGAQVTAISYADASARVDGSLTVTGSITSGFFINNGVITVGTLNAGAFDTTASSQLHVANGSFAGSIHGDGTVNTTGTWNIRAAADLAASLKHVVAGGGILTLEDVETLGTVENNGQVVFVENGTVASLSGSGLSLFEKDAHLTTLSGGTVTVGGHAAFTTLLGGSLMASGSVNGISVSGGALHLNANANVLQTVSGGTLKVNGTTTLETLENGAVTNNSLLTVATLNGGNLVNNGTLDVAGGNFTGILSSTGSLRVNGGLTLNGTQTAYNGLISVNATSALSVLSAVGTQTTVAVGSSASASFTPVVELAGLENRGTVSFTTATVHNLTGPGTTTFSGAAMLDGGISAGVVEVSGAVSQASNIGAVTGGLLTLGALGTHNVASIAADATVTLQPHSAVMLGNLTTGTLTLEASSALSVANGDLSGSVNGTGTLNITGAVRIAEAATLASGLGYTVADGGSLTVQTARTFASLDNSGNVTFTAGGALSSQKGAGTITVNGGALDIASGGAGSLIVGSQAAAAYAGAVSLLSVVNAGFLTVGSSSAVGEITSTGTLQYVGNLTISGAGTVKSITSNSLTSLTKNGDGKLSLDLNGAYAGNTFVNGGTLKLEVGTVLNGDVTVNGGSLILGGTGHFGSNLTLLNGVLDIGGKAQLLVGTLTASGGMLGLPNESATLTASALQITGGTQNATLLLSGTGTQSFTGVVTLNQIGVAGSSNPVELAGSGVSITAGTIYTQKITVDGTGNTLTITGTVQSTGSGAISIGGSNNTVEFTNGFTPGGGLTLIVGDATSKGAILDVGTGTGLVLAGAAQLLKGQGTISGNVSLGTGATFAPGNSPGRFTVTGTLSINPGASTVFEYTAEKQVAVGTGPADSLVVGALLSLGGSVSAIAVGGSMNGGTFTASGTSRVNQVGTKALPVILYTSGTAPTSLPAVTSYVTVGGTTYQSAVVTANLAAQNLLSGGTVFLNVTRNAFASFALGNAAATGALLDRALQSNNAAISAMIDHLDIQSTASAVASRLSALDPGVYADLGNIGLDRLRDIQSGLANHIDLLALDAVQDSILSLGAKTIQPLVHAPAPATLESAVEQSRVWTTGYGGWGKRSSDMAVGSAGYSSNHYGDISGVETKLGVLTLGILGAVGSSTATFENGKGKVTADSWHTGLYGNVPFGALVLDASVAYGQSENTLRRDVNVPGGGSTTGKSQGTEWTGQAGVAVPFRTDSGSLVVTPSLHVLHSNVRQDKITESSLGGLEAVVNANTSKSTALRTGVQAAKITQLAGRPTRLTASLDWIHSFESNREDVDIALTGAGTTTARFEGSKSGSDAVRFGLGGEVSLTDRTRFRVNVDQQVRTGVRATYGSASFSIFF